VIPVLQGLEDFNHLLDGSGSDIGFEVIGHARQLRAIGPGSLAYGARLWRGTHEDRAQAYFCGAGAWAFELFGFRLLAS
jgi:hypothetical protein